MADAILDKVRKLLRLAGNNNSPEEAAAAAAKAQAMIDEHNLNAAAIALDADVEPPDEPIQDFEDSPLTTGHRVDTWKFSLASVVSHANSCKPYTWEGRIHLIGRPSDVETVRYLFAYIARQIDALAESHGAGKGYVWRQNFRRGCVDTVSRKLAASRKEFKSERRALAQAEGSTALMRVDRALARVEARTGAVEAWQRANVKLRTTSAGRRQSFDSGAREAGRRAGESINVGSRARAALGTEAAND
jgi:hypothetical protein